MSGLSAAKAEAMKRVVRSLPDVHLRTLRSALASQPPGGWADPVRLAAEAETADRRLRAGVLAELEALAAGRDLNPLNPIAAFVPAVVWEGLHAVAPELIARAGRALAERETAPFEAASLDLVNAAAAGLADEAGPFAALRPRLDRSPGGADRVLRFLRVLPIARETLPRAAGWLKRSGEDEVSALRLAMRDAAALCEDGGPLLLDLLAAPFDDPWTALRLASAVMDRPSEFFMASSELAGVAEAVLDRVDAAVEAVRAFDGSRGREGGAAVAALTERAVDGLQTLEHMVELDREKAWGRRVAAQRRALSLAAEARLKEADAALASALPLQSPRGGALKHARSPPRLGAPIDALAVARAEALLTYVDETRRAAQKAGFGSLRAKVVEALDTRISAYVEDLLDQRHHLADEALDEANARLEIAADLLGLVREPGAAQIVRRRMAAA